MGGGSGGYLPQIKVNQMAKEMVSVVVTRSIQGKALLESLCTHGGTAGPKSFFLGRPPSQCKVDSVWLCAIGNPQGMEGKTKLDLINNSKKFSGRSIWLSLFGHLLNSKMVSVVITRPIQSEALCHYLHMGGRPVQKSLFWRAATVSM